MKPYKFSTEGKAKEFASRCTKTMMIVLGDDEKFWVVTFAEALRLVGQGLEVLGF